MLQTKSLGKQGHATSEMEFLGHPLSFGALAGNLAESENTSTTLQTYKPSCWIIEDEQLNHVNNLL